MGEYVLGFEEVKLLLHQLLYIAVFLTIVACDQASDMAPSDRKNSQSANQQETQAASEDGVAKDPSTDSAEKQRSKSQPVDFETVDTADLDGLEEVDPDSLESIEDIESGSGVSSLSTKEVYRYYNPTTGDHDFTATKGILENQGYDLETPIFKVLETQIAGSHPIYRCVTASGDHFISRANNCEGAQNTLVEMYGYLYSDAGNDNKTAFTRCQNGTDHFATVNTAECSNAAYTIEGVLGYLPQ